MAHDLSRKRIARCCAAALCVALAPSPALAQGLKPAPGPAKQQAAKPKPKPAGVPQGMPAEENSAGVQAVEAIYACVAQGLPEGWQRAWVTVTQISSDDKERTFEGKFTMSLEAAGDKRWDFVPCNARDVAQRVYALNDFLDAEKRQWKVATLLFMADGKFELKYDYTR